MNTTFTALAAWWQRLACRAQASRRLRRDRLQLARMSARELQDIGFAHPVSALAAAAAAPSFCR